VSVLQFIASLVRSLSWPAAVVGLAVVFRRPVAAALSRPLKRAKGGPTGFELEWQFTGAVTREEVERLGVEAPRESVAIDERQREREQLARVNPDAVVLRGYQDVERELRSLTVKVDPEAAHRFGAHGVAAIARKHGLISDATVKAVEGISVMRNLAAHGGEDQLTPERAMEYAALADAVLFAIRQEAGG
jgi:hypothetical protein